MSSPYSGLPSHQFWSSAVSGVAPHDLDPVIGSPLRLSRSDKVATLGSCFAQHVSRHLARSGMTYFVAEQPPAGVDAATASERGFGMFSARYGNVYTVRQAVQLFDRAFGAFEPRESPWRRTDGTLADPFRPRIEPGGFANDDALAADRAGHFAATRRVFSESQVLVFTLGLTEGWMSTVDGAVFPLAPGVAGGEFDPDAHAFVNFHCDEVVGDLAAFAERFHGVNPDGHLLLTVSPVPLIATYEPRHVLVSTTYSKAVLRVAAGEVAARHDFVHYFPSYEIITAPGESERYYADDLREVTDEGVAHVMRVFARHFTEASDGAELPTLRRLAAAEHEFVDEVICDEEVIEHAR
jgi:hypothetical protein